jgi:hypothetical protein
MTVLESVCGGMAGKVYSRLPGIAVQRGIEDVLVVSGRSYRWTRGCRHQSYGGGGHREVGGIFEWRGNQTLVGGVLYSLVLGCADVADHVTCYGYQLTPQTGLVSAHVQDRPWYHHTNRNDACMIRSNTVPGSGSAQHIIKKDTPYNFYSSPSRTQDFRDVHPRLS